MSKGKAATAEKGAPASVGDASAVTATANESGELEGATEETGEQSPPSPETEPKPDSAPPGAEGAGGGAPSSADLKSAGEYVAAWPISHDGRDFAAGDSLEGVEFEALAILAGCGAAVLVK